MASSHQTTGSASFSLFPSSNSSTPRPSLTLQLRRSESRERRALSPQQHGRRPSTPHAASLKPEADPSSSSSPPPQKDRPPPQHWAASPTAARPPQGDVLAAVEASQRSSQQSTPPASQQHQDALGLRHSHSHVRAHQPRLTIEVPRRPEKEPPQIQPPQMQHPQIQHPSSSSNMAYSRGSIAKPPLSDGPLIPPYEPSLQPLQSIFPSYNPDLSLQQQHYAPVPMTSSQVPRMPRAVISRQSFFEDPESQAYAETHRHNDGAAANQTRNNPPAIPKTSTAEQAKDLWKVANGWKASSLEGRVFCLALSQQKDAPVYTLSSASQPFYSLRLDPTSASAYVSLSRHDPSKALKASNKKSSRSLTNPAASGTPSSESQHWHEALSTTLEEEPRRHQPNDGLVAALMPSPATKMATERPDELLYVAAAEREYARLVWDDDSASYFLVHPALSTPFCVAIERSPAWSRVEYALEHHELPHQLAKLTRDGTGGGWLEIDTSIASTIEAYYIVDVAVATLLLIAAVEDGRLPAGGKTFDAPPVPEPARQSWRASSSHNDERPERKQERKKRDQAKIHSLEVDLESQDGSLAKSSESRDKSPFVVRVIVKVAKGLFHCLIWLLTVAFGCLKGVFMLFYSCVGSKY